MSVPTIDSYDSLLRSRQWWLVLILMAIPTWSMYDRLFNVLVSPDSLPPWMTTLMVTIQVVLLGLSLPWLLRRMSALPAIASYGILVMLAAMLVIGFFMLYPLADSGALGFVSDRDEALDIAVRQLWQGGNPYDCRAVAGVHRGCPQQGTLIAPLPGGILLAMPFVALGGSAGASLGLLLLTIFILWRTYRSVDVLWTFLILMLAGLPTVLAETFSGGDHLANALGVTLAAWWCLRVDGWQKALVAGSLLGLCLSWRAPFLLIGIPFLVAFAKKGGVRVWWIAGLAAVISFMLVSLPLYVSDPGGFTPLQTQGKLAAFDHLLPNATVWAAGSAVLVGVWLGWRARNQAGLLMAMGWTVAVPFLWAVVLQSLEQGYPTAAFFGWYLLMPASMVVLGYSMQLFDRDDLSAALPSGKNAVNE